MSKRTKPPFRADHVGSLLRPTVLKEAREKHAGVGHDPVVIEDRSQPVEFARRCRHRKCLLWFGFY